MGLSRLLFARKSWKKHVGTFPASSENFATAGAQPRLLGFAVVAGQFIVTQTSINNREIAQTHDRAVLKGIRLPGPNVNKRVRFVPEVYHQE